MSNPLAGGHAGESPYRYDPAARLSLTMGYSRDPLHDSRYPWWLPPRDRCAWSPEIARKRTRELERDRQAPTAIIGGLLVVILVTSSHPSIFENGPSSE